MVLPETPLHIEHLDRYMAIRNAWKTSREVLDQLRESLKDTLSGNVVTVGIAGSFGRGEGSPASDVDYIMIVEDERDDIVADDIEIITTAIKGAGAKPPNKSGVFSKPRTLETLLSEIGMSDELLDILGKRMLLLLETRSVYRDDQFEDVIDTIFGTYVDDYVRRTPSKEYTFLMNDLMRYFRFICVNYQSNFWRENEK